MKTMLILFVLASSVCYGQVTSNEVYEKLGYAPKTDTKLTEEAVKFSQSILQELVIFGEFKMPSSELGELTAYTGSREDVLKLIDSDREYYSESKQVFAYSSFDLDTDWTVVLVYILHDDTRR